MVVVDQMNVHQSIFFPMTLGMMMIMNSAGEYGDEDKC